MAKTYNIVTGPNHKVVNKVADRLARDFIDNCGHLTPAKQVELDNLLKACEERNAPESAANEVCEPNAEVLAMMEAPEMPELEPPPEAFEYERARAAH